MRRLRAGLSLGRAVCSWVGKRGWLTDGGSMMVCDRTDSQSLSSFLEGRWSVGALLMPGVPVEAPGCA